MRAGCCVKGIYRYIAAFDINFIATLCILYRLPHIVHQREMFAAVLAGNAQELSDYTYVLLYTI